MSDEIDEAELEGSAQQQKEIEKSFVSDRKQWNGKELQPYSASREAAADAMGLRYGSVGEEGQQQFLRTGLYPGMKRDIAIVLWLCAQATEREIDAAGADGISAARKAVEWARDNGLFDTGSESFAEGYRVFCEIMQETWANRTKPEKKSPSTT